MTSVSQYFFHRPRVAISLLIITHVAGVIGILTSYSELFLFLTPVNLLLSCLLLLSGHSNTTKKTVFGLALVGVIGFLVEWIGVHTGIIFGEYSYGATLGPKLDEIPIIIGVNWLILTYAIGNFIARFIQKTWIRVSLGALFMVGLDVLIEPVAIRYDMWSWASEGVPMMNYIAWFVVSLITMSIYFKYVHGSNNKIAEWVILVQVLFFGLLNFV